MKKSMLHAGLIAIICTPVYAQDNLTQDYPLSKTPNYLQLLALNTDSDKPSLPAEKKTNSAKETSQTKETPPNTQTPVTTATPPPASPSTTAPATTPAPATPPQALDCHYRIPAETTHIEQTVVMKWAEKATEQSFNFDPSKLDKQLEELQACYTEQGWQGYNDALQKSGNLNAIKSQHLMVSSMINGEGKITEIKDNQWKVSLPMQVVYQNDKEKLTQPLTINLVVGRKVSGDLGIMQMIAIPRQANTTNPENTPQPTP